MFNEMTPMAMGGGGKCKLVTGFSKSAGQGTASFVGIGSDVSIWGLAYSASPYAYANFDGNGDIVASTIYEFTFADLTAQRQAMAKIANNDIDGFIGLSTAVSVKSGGSYTMSNDTLTININVASAATVMGLVVS